MRILHPVGLSCGDVANELLIVEGEHVIVTFSMHLSNISCMNRRAMGGEIILYGKKV